MCRFFLPTVGDDPRMPRNEPALVLFIRTNDGFRRCRVRLRGFGTGSALSLLEYPVPVARAFWPEAPDPHVAAHEDVCGPVPGAVGVEAAIDSREAERLQPLRDAGADACGRDDQGVF